MSTQAPLASPTTAVRTHDVMVLFVMSAERGPHGSGANCGYLPTTRPRALTSTVSFAAILPVL